jgi:hypothetical protein
LGLGVVVLAHPDQLGLIFVDHHLDLSIISMLELSLQECLLHLVKCNLVQCCLVQLGLHLRHLLLQVI